MGHKFVNKSAPISPIKTMLIAVIPFGCFWSFWRIGKLKWGIVLFAVLVGLDDGLDYVALYIIEDGHPETSAGKEMYKILSGNESESIYIIAFMGNLAVLYVIYFYFIYRWTAKFNKSLSP